MSMALHNYSKLVGRTISSPEFYTAFSLVSGLFWYVYINGCCISARLMWFLDVTGFSIPNPDIYLFE
jgi:hypothetical protein